MTLGARRVGDDGDGSGDGVPQRPLPRQRCRAGIAGTGLGRHGGVGRFTAYKRLPLEGRQVCWAHLRRDFQKLVDAGPAVRPVGERLLAITAPVFELWHRYQAGALPQADWWEAVGRVIAEMEAVLSAHGRTGPPLVQTLCRELRAVWPA